jgi:hypothetical protein
VYACPSCCNTDPLIIAAVVWVRLIQTNEGQIETEPLDNDHEWDAMSKMKCGFCGYSNIAACFIK